MYKLLRRKEEKYYEKKQASFVLLGIALFAYFPNVVQGYVKPPRHAGKLSRGVGNMRYYVHPSAAAYSTWIASVVNNWMYTGYSNPIYCYKQSNNVGSAIDFHEESKGANNIAGITTYWDSKDKQQA